VSLAPIINADLLIYLLTNRLEQWCPTDWLTDWLNWILEGGEPLSRDLSVRLDWSCELCADLVNVMQLQRQLQSLQRAVDRERRAKVSLDNKRRSLESQINELTRWGCKSLTVLVYFYFPLSLHHSCCIIRASLRLETGCFGNDVRGWLIFVSYFVRFFVFS